MTFLNATLIFGMAAAVVPIVLHLIARREPRKVVFPSIRFLSQRFESNRSRLRVRRWWLLALRILAVVALALALARPAIHQSLSITWLTIGLIAAAGIGLLLMASVALARGQSSRLTYGLAAAAMVSLLAALLWGGYTYASGPAPQIDTLGPVAIAIVLDNSPTAAWQTASDDRLSRMQDLATWMVTRLPRSSRIAIVDRSAQPATFLLDVASAIAKIEQLTPLQVTQPIATRIDAAARLVRTSELPNRQVLVVTDLAQSSWDSSLATAGLMDTFAEDPPVALTVFDLGAFAGVNRSLSIPSLADATPPRGVPVALSTRLEIAGQPEGSAASVTAELQMFENDPGLPVIRDGVVSYPPLRSVDRTNATVSDSTASELLLTIPSLETGMHHGLIRLIGEDAMPLDDIRYFSLEVLPPSSVLMVSDDEDEARILRQAITASPVLVDDQNPEFLVERISYADLAAVRFGDFEAILLLDPPAEVLTDRSLVEYVQRGGGVLVCLGPAAGEQPIGSELVPSLVRRWRVPDPGTFLQVTAVSHPATAMLASDTPWADFRIHQYWQVTASEADKVLMGHAGTDHPALLERSFAAAGTATPGRLLVLTTPLPALSRQTRSWNDLFGIDPWPAWLLTRQAVEYLTRRGGTDAMALVGAPQAIKLAWLPGQATAERGQRLQLFPPGAAAAVPLDVSAEATQVVVSDTSRAGTYWLRGATPGIGFSANLPDDAIRTDRIEPTQLDVIFGPQRYNLAKQRDEIELAESQATQRVSLHSPAMLLALVVFLLEQILGNRFYRSRGTAAGAGTVPSFFQKS